MARRKANDLENQMSLMDMMASESPEYTEEGPEELLDPGEDTGDSDGQTDKPFKLVANNTTKAKASISTQALSVVKAIYADTVETNWEELFDGFDRLYAITFSSGIEFVNKVINKFSYAEVVFGCEKIIANDIAAIMSVQIDSVQRLAKSKSAGSLANRLDDGSLQLYVSRDTKSHEKIFILESADHKRVRVITGSANMSASAFCGIQRENIVCFDDEAAFSHYKVLFETFKETCSDNVSYKAVVNTMNQEDYLKDQKIITDMTPRFFLEFLNGMMSVQEEEQNICYKKDVLFLAGEEDPVANGLNKVIEKYKKSNANIKKNIIPRFRHDILHDSCKETVFRCIADFL